MRKREVTLHSVIERVAFKLYACMVAERQYTVNAPGIDPRCSPVHFGLEVQAEC